MVSWCSAGFSGHIAPPTWSSPWRISELEPFVPCPSSRPGPRQPVCRRGLPQGFSQHVPHVFDSAQRVLLRSSIVLLDVQLDRSLNAPIAVVRLRFGTLVCDQRHNIDRCSKPNQSRTACLSFIRSQNPLPRVRFASLRFLGEVY
jgi:hypothetical protein